MNETFLSEPCTKVYAHVPHVIEMVTPPLIVHRVVCPGFVMQAQEKP